MHFEREIKFRCTIVFVISSSVQKSVSAMKWEFIGT